MRLDGIFGGKAALAELDEYRRRRESGEIITIRTGLRFIDEHLEIEPENVVVIAARP